MGNKRDNMRFALFLEEYMGLPNINGGWLSKNGKLVYIITQVDDKFMWQVAHTNGVTETGIGLFSSPNANDDVTSTAVEVQWIFHGGYLKSGIRRATGTVIL